MFLWRLNRYNRNLENKQLIKGKSIFFFALISLITIENVWPKAECWNWSVSFRFFFFFFFLYLFLFLPYNLNWHSFYFLLNLFDLSFSQWYVFISIKFSFLRTLLNKILFVATSIMGMEWCVCFEGSFITKFTFELFLLDW